MPSTANIATAKRDQMRSAFFEALNCIIERSSIEHPFRTADRDQRSRVPRNDETVLGIATLRRGRRHAHHSDANRHRDAFKQRHAASRRHYVRHILQARYPEFGGLREEDTQLQNGIRVAGYARELSADLQNSIFAHQSRELAIGRFFELARHRIRLAIAKPQLG